jgi:molecular chaperone DnaK
MLEQAQQALETLEAEQAEELQDLLNQLNAAIAEGETARISELQEEVADFLYYASTNTP